MKTKGKLTTTLRTSIMKLLQKGNKDPTNSNSFRPTNLLFVIYKIASCAISNRIEKNLPVIIGKQQKAYVPNDNIDSCLLNLLSTIQHCNKNKLDGLLLLIDFRKTFDSIDHSFISRTLKAFNFGDILQLKSCWNKVFLKET